MKKQLIIRILAAGIPVYDVAYGEIRDGQFTPTDLVDLPADILDCIVLSDFLGTQAYVQASHLRELIACAVPYADEVSFYPNFIVLSFVDGYGTEKKEDEE
nr:MAG TPA: hypothetical protein [Microviridae sp.]